MFRFLTVLKRVAQCNLMNHGLWNANPYYVTFNITYECNSRCKTCGIWKTYIKNPELRKKELDLSGINHIFQEIPEPLWLTLSGGEPVLRDDILDICQLAHTHFPNLYGIGILTNGLLPEQFIHFIKEILDIGFNSVKASVSIDGVGNAHDRMRGVRGSYEKALKTYVMLKDIAKENSKLSIVISRTVSSMNAGTLNLVDSEAINDLYLSIAQNGIAFSNLDYEFKMNKEAILSDLDFLLQNADFQGVYKKIKKVFTKKCKSFIEEPRMILPCSALIASCLVDPYGNIYPCTIWDRKIGNLQESSFNDIWNSDRAKETRELIKQEMCPICWSGCESSHCILQSFHKVLGDFLL